MQQNKDVERDEIAEVFEKLGAIDFTQGMYRGLITEVGSQCAPPIDRHETHRRIFTRRNLTLAANLLRLVNIEKDKARQLAQEVLQ